jgi:phytoene dehydrogenase-like protein
VSAIDAVVVGAGPNGLAAAIELARAGRSVKVIERADDIGGGSRTAELTLPGFHHDVCSAVHPLAAGSPFFRGLALERYGLELVGPELDAAHPLDDGTAVAFRRSLPETAGELGVDGGRYARLLGPFADNWPELADAILGPPRIPRDPLIAARFGLFGAVPGAVLARMLFSGTRARALLAGMAAHAIRALSAPGTGAFALVLLALGHAVGWPIVRGGSQALASAMRTLLESLGGEVQTGREIRSLRELPPTSVVLFDISPRRLVEICGDDLPGRYRRELGRYRYGPGVFKLDYALDGPVPWRAADCAGAGTVHLGGTLEEIAAGELAVSRGSHPEQPFVLVSQQSMVDATRAPAGKHTLWAYCHVPNGSDVDMTVAIERQIERFAPGFSDLVLARAARGPAQLEAENPNYVGGDINCGTASLSQVLFRPVARISPYRTPNPRVFLCSAATPPGGGVHGMCGYHAARAVLRQRLS